MKIINTIALLLFLASGFIFAQPIDQKLPSWTKNVGSNFKSKNNKIFSVNNYGAKPDGESNSTKAIQQAIDECSKNGG
jgi:polygalacturonase